MFPHLLRLSTLLHLWFFIPLLLNVPGLMATEIKTSLIDIEDHQIPHISLPHGNNLRLQLMIITPLISLFPLLASLKVFLVPIRLLLLL